MLTENDTVELAFQVMSQGGFRHIPVLNISGQLCGVLSVRSFMQHLAHCIIEELED